MIIDAMGHFSYKPLRNEFLGASPGYALILRREAFGQGPRSKDRGPFFVSSSPGSDGEARAEKEKAPGTKSPGRLS